MANPALNDLLKATGTLNETASIPVGTNGQVLQVVGGIPAWASAIDTDFTVLTANGELTADRSSYDVGTEGTGVFTLPTPSAGLNGAIRGIWRTGAFSTTDYISITGFINGINSERRIGLVYEYIKFVCDGVTWLENGHNIQAFCTPQVTSSATFSLTTGFTKFTEWDTNPVFQTPGKLLWNDTNSQIDVPIVENAIEDGYRINLIMIIEFTNNKIVEGIIAIDGVQTNGTFPVNALGSGKPVQLQMPLAVGFPTGSSTIEVQLKGESAGTLTVLSARWTVSRIRG